MTGRLRMRRVTHVLSKELREAVRDRNMLVNVVLVPLFLYPVLGFLFFQVFLVMQGVSEREVTRIAVATGVPVSIADSLRAREGVEVVDLPEGLTDTGGRPAPDEFRKVRAAALASGESPVRAALLWEEREAGDASAVLFFDRSRERSVAARDTVVAALDQWRRRRLLAAMTGVGLREADLDVWSVDFENTASAEQRGQEILATVLPMVLLLMLAQGTFYAALDTVVGERERGTWETILTSPLGRGETLLGKFLFVVLASVVALLLNLASLTIFFGFLLDLMGGAGEIRVVIRPEAVLLIFAVAVLTACLIAAVLMVLAAPAKTYREGQALLTPAYLVILVPAMVVTFQRQPFGMEQALVPVLNSVALFKAALRGDMPAGPIAVTIGVLAVLSAAALAAAARIVRREEVWFDPAFTLRRLLTGRGGGKT